MKLFSELRESYQFRFLEQEYFIVLPAPRPNTLLLHLSNPVAGWQRWFMDLATCA